MATSKDNNKYISNKLFNSHLNGERNNSLKYIQRGVVVGLCFVFSSILEFFCYPPGGLDVLGLFSSHFIGASLPFCLYIHLFTKKKKLQTMLTLTTKHKQLAAKIYEFTITNWRHIRSFWSNFHSFILYTRITPYIYTHTHAQKRLTKSRKNLYLKLVIRLTIWQLNILTQWNKIQLVIPIQKI